MKMQTIFCGLLAAVSLWTTSGCGDTTIVAPGVTATEEGDTLTIKSPGSEVKAATGDGGIKLPNDFPADVPIYPKVTIKIVNQLPAAKTLMIGFETPASTGKVWDFYEKKFADQGWEFNLKTKVEKGGHISVKKGNRICTITIGERRKTGYTSANLTLQTNPKKP